MKNLLFYVIFGAWMLLPGFSPGYGFSLSSGKTPSVNRWQYSFGNRYIYDNAGSSWNFNTASKHKKNRYHRGNRHGDHRRLRFDNDHQKPNHEKLDGLLKHFTRSKRAPVWEYSSHK